jgi:hypothetical protein
MPQGASPRHVQRGEVLARHGKSPRAPLRPSLASPSLVTTLLRSLRCVAYLPLRQ